MQSKLVFLLWATAVFSVFPAVAEDDAAEKGRALADLMDTKDEGYTDAVAQLTMIIRNRSGDEARRELTVKTLEREDDGDYSLMRFEFPADIRGTVLLTQPKHDGDDRQWLFMPSINRVKRISSRNKSGPFVGSEFSFEDLSDHSVDDYHYRYLGKEDCELSLDDGDEERRVQTECERLERVPKDSYSGYSREVVTLEPKQYRIIQIEYYDRKDSFLKVFSTSRFKLFDERYWRPMQVKMDNMQSGRSTELLYDQLEFGVGLSESEFNRNSLSR